MQWLKVKRPGRDHSERPLMVQGGNSLAVKRFGLLNFTAKDASSVLVGNQDSTNCAGQPPKEKSPGERQGRSRDRIRTGNRDGYKTWRMIGCEGEGSEWEESKIISRLNNLVN